MTLHRRFLLSACALLASVGVGTVEGGDWSFVPHLSLSEEYTDNVTLAGQNTLADYITSVNTGLSVRGTSRRLNSNVDYNVEKQIYDSEDDFTALIHQMQGSTALTVVDQLLYFEANSSISQQVINNQSTFGRTNRSRAGNQVSLLFREYKPIVRHRFGRWAAFEGSFTTGSRSTIGQAATSVGSGDDERKFLQLSSGPALSVMPVEITFDSSESTFQSGIGNKQERVDAQISYIFDRRLRLITRIGNEENTSSSGNGDQKGTTWSVGGTWTPSSRTDFSGDYGKRAFGEMFNISARHRHRRWILSGRYNEDFRTRTQELRDLVLVPLNDAFGNPIFEPTANPNILNPNNLASLNESAFLSKSINIDLAYEGRHTNFSFGFFDTQRTGQAATIDNTVRGWNASVNRSLSRKFSVGLSVNFRETLTGNILNNEDFLISPSVNYRLGPHSDLNVSYTYRDGGGPDIDDNYLENSLTAALTLHY
ncbi:MAG: hypothetical protein ACI8XZ_002677 [Gammaproteobacteria bacterium]